MYKNYLKIAWRNLSKHKLQSGINILGLTVGIASCLAILIYVLAQTGYDTAFSDAGSIYRLRTKIKHQDRNTPDSDLPSASPPIAFAMKEDFPEVEEVSRIVYINQFDSPIRLAEKTESHYAQRGYLADSTFFSLFDYPILEGTAKGALNTPQAIVLSATLAGRLFGKEPALHKTVVLGAGEDASRKTVTAVFDDSFAKTHLNPNYIISMNTPGLGEFVRNNQNYAAQNFIFSYVKLREGTKARSLEQKLPEFLRRRGSKDLADAGFEKTLLLQPIQDIHLYSEGIGPQLDTVSDSGFLRVLLLLATAILLVACINYINLKTAFANKRAKEIGMRKVVGAGKGSLAYQFLGESLLITITAVLLSIPLTIMLLPLINEFGQTQLGLPDVFNPRVLLSLAGLAVITGFIAGTYPALVLAAVKPINALRGSSGNISPGSGHFRKALVICQFAMSAFLIVAVIVVLQQLRFGQSLNLGYEQDNLLAVRLGTNEVSGQFTAMRETFANIAGVTAVAGSNNYPSQQVLGDFGGHLPGTDPAQSTSIHYSGISPGYLATTSMRLVAGRDLRATDSTQTIVNLATLKALDIPLENALATTIINTYEGESQYYQVIGVVEDFHYAPLTEKIAPIALFNENRPGWMVLKLATNDYQGLMETLESHWLDFTSETPFEYTFVDRQVQKLFEAELILGRIAGFFTALTIFVSCLGLFGLVSYIAEQRKKEIGIRKVLGANINTIVLLLAREFLRLVAIALLVAFPLAYYFMQTWLEGFSYQITIRWWVFLLAGCIAFGITIVTVSFQSLKAAMANPVKSLRTE